MIRAIGDRLSKSREVARFERRADRQREAEAFVADLLERNPDLSADGRLAGYEHQVWSQNGEDGVIEEIFARIGEGTRRFVEFGCGDGIENNTVYLLHKSWAGLWFDADPALVAGIRESHSHFIDSEKLALVESAVSAENVEKLFEIHGIQQDLDLLSIDIDGNDYWVWKAIRRWNPRVVVVEYNAMWPPGVGWVQSYRPDREWDGTSHHGAAIAALASLGAEKGYALVHCDLAGVNAFFVREDLLGEWFPGEHTAERMWQPARYFLSVPPARRRGLGGFEMVH